MIRLSWLGPDELNISVWKAPVIIDVEKRYAKKSEEMEQNLSPRLNQWAELEKSICELNGPKSAFLLRWKRAS